MRANILIIEDDPFMARMLTFLLSDAGYESTTIADARAVMPFLAENSVDLLLLDITLPHIDGFDLAEMVRRRFPDIPIIFVSSRGGVRDRVAGFGHGADDYITKPFEPIELLARVGAVLQRYRRTERSQADGKIRAGDAILDIGQALFTLAGRVSVRLAPTEMKILECLMRNAGMIVPRERLIGWVWARDTEGAGGRINVYIGRLREKIEVDPQAPELVRTVRGLGYTFHPPRLLVTGARHQSGPESGYELGVASD